MDIFTIGYAGLTESQFVKLLKQMNVSAVADVRSSPYSKTFPGFNRENMPNWLSESGIRYVYLGEELGPRSMDPAHYKDDQVQFERLKQTELFNKGIRRLENGSKRMTIAIMCAEKDPMTCHRSLLVAHYGQSSALSFHHIHQNGEVESHAQMLRRAMGALKIEEDMFTPIDQCLEKTYQKLCTLYAYKKITRAPEGVPFK
ncbi:DUF488 family protein [Pseudomonas luteola]